MSTTIDRRLFLTRSISTAAAVTAGVVLTGAAQAHAAIAPITSIQIPKLSLSKAVYSGTAKATLDLGGFGHWLGTAQPGKLGNCMLFAHRTSAGGPLRYVNKMVAGDKITMAGKTYTVTARVVLPVAQMPTAINWNPGRRAGLTLVSCSRADGLPTSLAYRIVVHAVA